MNGKLNDTSNEILKSNFIKNGTDTNTLLSVGKYYISSNVIAGTLVNLPAKLAGTIYVIDTISNKKNITDGNYTYFNQLYFTFNSDLYTRLVTNTPSGITYAEWTKKF